MKHRTWRSIALSLITVVGLPQAFAQDGLTHVRRPEGGEIAYGAVDGTSVASAMGAVLRRLHAQFGARPEIGRVVEVRGSGSTTLRFSIRPARGAPVAGMIVVTPGGAGLEAGVVYDDALRLPTSFTPMVQALTAAWHPVAVAQAAGGGAPAAALRTIVLRDNSARVGLPEGWRLDAQSGGGTILAYGTDGEFAALGAPYFVIDPRSPAGRQAQASGGRMYGGALILPFGLPLGRTFMELTRQTTERTHQPWMPIRVDSEEPLASQGGARCAHLRGQGGIQAGRGPASFDTVFCVSPPQAGSWIALAYHVAAPAAVAGQERATLLAIRASFEQNKDVVDRQASAIAAPVIAQIHEIGRQSALAAAQADATRVDMRHRFESYNDTRDRLSQGFSNYLRDQTVILDGNTGEHATTWNSVAESMVKNEPQRYSHVDTPGYWKGVDY